MLSLTVMFLAKIYPYEFKIHRMSLRLLILCVVVCYTYSFLGFFRIAGLLWDLPTFLRLRNTTCCDFFI